MAAGGGVAVAADRIGDSGKRLETRMRWELASLLLLAAGVVHASEAQLKDGNRLFWKGKYAEALKHYDSALIDSPNSSILHFNAGAAAYQTGDAVAAERHFKEAGDLTAVPELRSSVRYNQGVALFRQGKWQEAVDAYKDCLRANPADEDAKYNLGVALAAKQNPPQQQPQSGGQKKDDKQDDKQSQPKDGKGDEQKDEGQAQPKPGQMSKEDAERLMSAAAASEAKKSGQKAPKGGVPNVEEDW